MVQHDAAKGTINAFVDVTYYDQLTNRALSSTGMGPDSFSSSVTRSTSVILIRWTRDDVRSKVGDWLTTWGIHNWRFRECTT